MTSERYVHILRCFFQFLEGRGQHWRQARPTDLAAYREQLLWTGNRHGGLQSSNTVYQHERLLRSFYRWARTQGYLSKDPTEAWILPRPPQPERGLLTWTQTLQLFHLPDVSRPAGQRDAALLRLLYHGVTLHQCWRLRLRDLEELPGDEDLRAAVDRYIHDGRAQRARPDCSELLLRDDGRPFETFAGLRMRLLVLRQALGWPELTARLLNASRLAHAKELAHRRHFPAGEKVHMGEICQPVV